MENAGLCLDRFGMPYIPGSAVKGCARRMATKRLMEADTAQAKTEMLVNMALVFGWGDTDWRPGRRTKRKDGQVVESEPRCDFWWAMADDEGDHSADSRRSELWSEVARMAAGELLDHLQIRGRKHGSEPWLDLPNFAGSVGFLAAYPVDASGADMPLRQYDRILFHPKGAIPVDFEPDNQLFVVPVEDVVAVFRPDKPENSPGGAHSAFKSG